MFSNPEKNIEQFDIDPGMKVADLGVGSGHYALAAGKKAGLGGKVYAVDIQKDLLTKAKSHANHENVNNVEIIWGNIEEKGGTTLPENSVDRVILSNILFQLEDKRSAIEEVIRILKPGGKVLVIDWTDSFSNIGPSPDAVFDAFAAQDLFEEVGFNNEKSISAGEHHYGIIFRKPTGNQRTPNYVPKRSKLI